MQDADADANKKLLSIFLDTTDRYRIHGTTYTELVKAELFKKKLQ